LENYIKKPITSDQINPLCKKFNIDPILASVFIRRDITDGKEILYYLEDDIRFMHEPFLLPNMEDAVTRILQAQEDNEKILIYGDSDADGITSTVILYNQLKNMGIDVQWKVPAADDAYGLSMQAIDDFAKEEGSLIITVDCGISNFKEVEHANELGINVIVTDHHNPQGTLPDAILIIDPKLEDSNYPYQTISGAAVAFKLASALRFSQTEFYNSEISILNMRKNVDDAGNKIDNNIIVECLKIKNNVKIKQLTETIIPGVTNFYDLKFPQFLNETGIFVWDINRTQKQLEFLFGSNVQFNLYDLRSKIGELIPQIKTKTTEELSTLSTLAKYDDSEKSVINCIYNIYLSFCRRSIMQSHPQFYIEEKKDLQLVGLSTLGDIMPMKDENRLFVKNGIYSIQKDGPRTGLAELLVELQLNVPQYANLNSTVISWKINPVLNSPGRLGKADIVVKMFLSEDPKERVSLAKQVAEMNNERKQIVQDIAYHVRDKAVASIQEYDEKLCVVVDEYIKPGLTGLFANRLMSDFSVPSIAIAYSGDICIGSIRSFGNMISTDFLETFGDFFINHGGHNFAAGFSFQKEKLQDFLKGVKERLNLVPAKGAFEPVTIDAEIPVNYMSADIFKILDIFEPYGSENPDLTFLTKAAPVCDMRLTGQKEPMNIKLCFDFGKVKVPAILWNQGNRYNKDILLNQNYDIIYKLEHNYFKGKITDQFNIIKI